MPRGRGAIIYLERLPLDTEVAGLEAAGVVFMQGPRAEPWLWRGARLKDPDGREICLYDAGENRLNPPCAVKR